MLNYFKNIKYGQSAVSKILMIAVLATPIPSQVSAGIGQIFADSGMSSEDLSIIKSTAKGLYDVDNPKVGSHSSWENTESGASGVVTITNKDGRCVDIRHNITLPKASSKKQTYNTRRCKNDNGAWQIGAPN